MHIIKKKKALRKAVTSCSSSNPVQSQVVRPQWIYWWF